MSTALSGVDGVGIRVDRFGIRRGPTHGDFHAHGSLVVFCIQINDLLIDWNSALRGIQILHVVGKTPLVEVGDVTSGVLILRRRLRAGDLQVSATSR